MINILLLSKLTINVIMSYFMLRNIFDDEDNKYSYIP